MTEAEWLACDDPARMLEWLHSLGAADLAGRPRTNAPSDRKLRLFACACCRHSDVLLPEPTDERDVLVVETAEAWADSGIEPDTLPRVYCFGAGWCVYRDAASAAREWARNSGRGDGAIPKPELMADILRDIFGNPWRQVAIRDDIEGECFVVEDREKWSVIERSTLLWHDHTIPRLAQAIYDERAFDRMPILADALEEAGCENEDILAHARSDAIHVRGCWVLDLLLGKS